MLHVFPSWHLVELALEQFHLQSLVLRCRAYLHAATAARAVQNAHLDTELIILKRTPLTVDASGHGWRILSLLLG